MRKQNRRVSAIVTVILSGYAILCIVPAVLVISGSFSTATQLSTVGYRLFPSPFALDAYKMVFKSVSQILDSYGVSILVTVAGTIASLIISAMIAYPLSISSFRSRRILNFYVYFTMLFSGGLVPSYILITQYLHLRNNLLVLILPFIAQPFIIFLLRVFFSQLPGSFSESAKIDGASDFTIFFRLYLPLSKPGLATAGLILTLTYWNDWFTALIYINKPNLYPLQLLLVNIVNYTDYVKRAMATSGIPIAAINVPTEAITMATCLVAILPMFFLFMFFQKYFVKGIYIGGIKG